MNCICISLIFVIFTSCFVNVKAQNYELSTGAQVGLNSGFTAKYFVAEKIAFEGLALYKPGRFTFLGLVEFQNAIGEPQGLDYFIGLGFHTGVGKYNDKSQFLLGLNLNSGIEHTFSNVPVVLGVNIRPGYATLGKPLLTFDAGIFVRYIFH